MISPKTARALALMTSVVLGAPAVSLADSPLREGHSVDAGESARKGFTLRLKSDQDLIPIPGGGKLNATRMGVTLSEFAGESSVPQVETAELRVLTWSHLRALGLRFDTQQGSALEADLVGVSVPVAIWGTDTHSGFGILHAGVDTGFRFQHALAGAKESDLQAQLKPSCRVDVFQPLTDRLGLEIYGEVLARLNADTEGVKDLSAETRAGGALVYDFSSEGPYRKTTRTNPKTGQKEVRKIPNQEMRLKWKLVGVDWESEWGNAQVPGEKTRTDHLVSTGVRYEF